MQKILADLKQGNYQPVYFLHGDEPYFIDQISNYIESKILQEHERAFNQMVLYGKDVKAEQVIDACRQFPMMASHRVVVLKEAQEMRDIKLLESYVEQPSSSTILCLCYKHKKLDLRSKFGKIVKAKAVMFQSKKLYDNQVAAYVGKMVAARKRKIDAPAAALIAEYIGADLSTLHNELEKLFVQVQEGTTITASQVQSQIGISKEYNVFELQTALGKRDYLKVFRIAKYFQANPKKNNPIAITGSLFRYFTGVYIAAQYTRASDQDLARKLAVNPYFVKDYRVAAKNYSIDRLENIFHVLKTYDLKSKGVGNKSFMENTLLVEMLVKILS